MCRGSISNMPGTKHLVLKVSMIEMQLTRQNPESLLNAIGEFICSKTSLEIPSIPTSVASITRYRLAMFALKPDASRSPVPTYDHARYTPRPLGNVHAYSQPPPRSSKLVPNCNYLGLSSKESLRGRYRTARYLVTEQGPRTRNRGTERRDYRALTCSSDGAVNMRVLVKRRG
jgi:hypothetical protein